jgi:hypothetical protein
VIWNKTPIVKIVTSNGVTVSVSAPKGSFPEGTTVQVDSLGATKTDEILSSIEDGVFAKGFDISFFTADGQKVQPSGGNLVHVRFSVNGGGLLSDSEEDESALRVYHVNDNGHAEKINSSSVTKNDAVQIDLNAKSFSPYVIVREQQRASAGANRNGTSSTNLANFLTEVNIDAPIDNDGNYIVDPHNSYEVTFRFAEGITFSWLTMKPCIHLPSGYELADSSDNLSITVRGTMELCFDGNTTIW